VKPAFFRLGFRTVILTSRVGVVVPGRDSPVRKQHRREEFYGTNVKVV
jgi:hypothetical protein